MRQRDEFRIRIGRSPSAFESAIFQRAFVTPGSQLFLVAWLALNPKFALKKQLLVGQGYVAEPLQHMRSTSFCVQAARLVR